MGILIVEDSAFQARILAELLKPAGSALFVAMSAREAFEVLQTVQISVVISDLYMPAKDDGLRFIKRVLALPEPTDLRLFVCTVDDSIQTRADLNALGVSRVFIKPYNPNEMLRIVREVFWCGGDGEAKSLRH
jgi:CheY-like chemotaxis protein